MVSVLWSFPNVLGFFFWGVYSGRERTYAIDGNIRFSGNSNRYLIQTVESFNGRRNSFQGNFTDWFSSNAFGGTNYSNTPVGAVAHVEEPLIAAINSTYYFRCWEEGQPFAECAWASKQTPYFMAVGDPLVTK